MNRTKIEWVKNPDGNQGYTWNPITGCLNHSNGLCKGGGFPCYAHRLAHGRLKERYLRNVDIPQLWTNKGLSETSPYLDDPFYPRFWEERFVSADKFLKSAKKSLGIFPVDMGDWLGIGVPYEWSNMLYSFMVMHKRHRFYSLTKQPQNLIKFSPFPENVYLGVTATNWLMFSDALGYLATIQARVKYLSFEPLLGEVKLDMMQQMLFPRVINWVVIGAQTTPKKLPQWEWVEDIIKAADRAGIPVFLKDNLGLPRLSCEGGMPFYKKDPTGTMVLRQEMP